MESFTESMGQQLGAEQLDRRLSSGSSMKRMSYITELRSKRDVSDSASFITVDEITAEVESRRENGDVDNGWTTINSEGDEEHTSSAPVDVPTESVGDEDDDEIDLEGDMSDESDEEEDETGRTMSSGSEYTYFLTRNLCVLTGHVQESNGSKVPSSVLVLSGRFTWAWTPQMDSSWR
jgi:mitogen-activated protein kinase kinase kinase